MIRSYTFLLIALMAVSQVVFSQTHEVKTIVKPYERGEYFPNVVKTPIKQVAIYSSHDSTNSIFNDTITVNVYDTLGRKVQEIKPDKNDMYANTVFYSYDSNNRVVKSIDQRVSGMPHTILSSYDKKGNLTLVRGFYLDKANDTVNMSIDTYLYDTSNLLVHRSNGSISTSYKYKDGRLVVQERQSRSSPLLIRTTYSYNKKGELEFENSYHVQNGQAEQTGNHSYTYANGKLIAQSSSGLGYGNSSIHVTYEYNEQNQLVKTNVGMDSLYMHISYEYKNGQVSHVEVKKNTWRNFMEFYVPLSLNNRNQVPYTYDEYSYYDSFGNITRKEQFLDKELKKVIRYDILYY